MRPARCIALAIALLVATAASGAAQSRPYRGLFGGGEPLGTRGQSLDLTLSGFGGWDEPGEVSPEVSPSDTTDRVDIEGPYTGSSATLMYTRPGDKLNLSGYGSGFVGYFTDNEPPWYTSSSAAFLASSRFDLTGRTRLSLTEQVGWATDYRLGLTTGGTAGSDIPLASGNTGFDNALARAPSISSTSNIDLTHDFTAKSSLSTFYNYRYLYFLESENVDLQRSNLKDQAVGVRYNYRVIRYATVHAGYAYRRTSPRDAGVEDVVFHDIDLGVNYNRTLSISKRTHFSFNTGSTVVATQQQTTDNALFAEPRFYFTGGAALTHDMGRTWTARTEYNREVIYQDGFNLPSLLDRASAGVGGLLGRRTDVSAGVYWTSGAIGLDERNYQSWMASAQIRTGITRNLAAYAYYYYYLYDFGASVDLPQGLVRHVDRQGVRVGLTTWFPLWASRGAP